MLLFYATKLVMDFIILPQGYLSVVWYKRMFLSEIYNNVGRENVYDTKKAHIYNTINTE